MVFSTSGVPNKNGKQNNNNRVPDRSQSMKERLVI